MHGDETPIWDFVCRAVPATIVLISVFMLTLLIGAALGGSL